MKKDILDFEDKISIIYSEQDHLQTNLQKFFEKTNFKLIFYNIWQSDLNYKIIN